MSQSGAAVHAEQRAVADGHDEDRLPSSIATMVCLTAAAVHQLGGADGEAADAGDDGGEVRGGTPRARSAAPRGPSRAVGVPAGVGGEQQQAVGGDDGDRVDAWHLLDEVAQQPVQIAGFTAQAEGTGRGLRGGGKQLTAPSTFGLSSEARNLQWLLTNLVEEVPGVQSVAVVSSDGLLLLSSDARTDGPRGPRGGTSGPRGAVRRPRRPSSPASAASPSARPLMDAGSVKQTMVAMEDGSLSS